MIRAILGEDAVRDGPPVLQAARTRTTANIRGQNNQGDAEMQDAPGAGDDAGDAPNPPEDGETGGKPPDAGQQNPGGGDDGGGDGGVDDNQLKVGAYPPHRMDGIFAACKFSKAASDMAIHFYDTEMILDFVPQQLTRKFRS
jgi:hypothetical protein